MTLSHNSRETSPYNGATPHILQSLGQIQGEQRAQGQSIQDIKIEQREQGGRLRVVEAALTSRADRSPWWANDRLYLLLAALGAMLLLPRDLQELVLKWLTK